MHTQKILNERPKLLIVGWLAILYSEEVGLYTCQYLRAS